MFIRRFIMNTDYDSQKEYGTLEIELNVAQFSLAAHATRTFTASVLCDEGEYFENISTKNSLVGSYSMIGGSPNYHKSSEYDLYFNIYRSDSTHYTLQADFVSQKSSAITIPENTTHVKIHLFVAAKQQ